MRNLGYTRPQCLWWLSEISQPNNHRQRTPKCYARSSLHIFAPLLWALGQSRVYCIKDKKVGFPQKVKDQIFVDTARHCCVCHRYKGVKVEVHHIKQEALGGENTYENAISLCFDCHCDAGHYNPKHPRGTDRKSVV